MGLRFKPATKRVGYYITALLLFYWLFIRQRRVSEKFEIVLSDVEPKALWEYWADFSNYKKINPTVIDFEIDYEKGTYDNWEYGVTFTEYLTIIPFKVNIKGRYIVTPQQKRGHFSEPFRILSEHDSCLWIFCSHSDTDMTFLPSGVGKTKVIEMVSLSSPIMMTWYYVGEFRTQRKHIAEQLEQIDFGSI